MLTYFFFVSSKYLDYVDLSVFLYIIYRYISAQEMELQFSKNFIHNIENDFIYSHIQKISVIGD
jgi:hypothetical protein